MDMTYVDKLPSGPKFEVRRMKAYHQEWLSQGRSNRSARSKTNKAEKNIDDVLADIVVSIGDDTDITIEKIQKICSWDLKYMLLVARFFSCDIHFYERVAEHRENEEEKRLAVIKEQFEKGDITEQDYESMGVTYRDEPLPLHDLMLMELEPRETKLPEHIFKFRWEYEHDGQLNTHEFAVPLELHMFDIVKPYKQWNTLEAIEQDKENWITLPICKKRVCWRFLDVAGENRYKNTMRGETMHVNKPIEWRHPRYEFVNENNKDKKALINLPLSNLDLLDIEALREDIFNKEGRVDSNIIVEHPETGKQIKIDVVNVAAFFIPSGVV